MLQEISSAESSYYAGWAERPYNPDALFKRAGGYQLYDEMLEDDQIAPLSLLKKYIILNPEFVVESESDKVQKFFEDVIFKELDNPFKAYSLEQLSHFDYGNSLSEPVFEQRNIPGWGEQVVLKTIKTRAPHSIEYHQHPNGDIKFIRQLVDREWLDFQPGKFLHLINNPKFSNPYGKSDLTVGVYRAWFGKKILIRFLNIYLERFGAPALVAYYNKNATKSVLDKLQAMLPSLAQKAGVMLPDDIKIDEMTTRNAGRNPFIDAITNYNLQIARALLVPDLAGYGGSETAGGSYSLGEEQYKAWYSTLELPKDMYLWQLNKKVIQPLVRWNFGDTEARCTEAKLRGESGKESRENAKLFLDAVNTGGIKPTLEAANTFLRQIGYPEIPEAEWEKEGPLNPSREPVYVQPKTPEPTGEPVPEEQDPQPQGAPPAKDPRKNPALPPEKKFAAAGFGRELTVYERKVDYAGMDSGLSSLENKYGQLLQGRQAAIVDRLMGFVERKRIVEDKRMDLLKDLRLPGREEEAFKKDMIRMLIDASNSGATGAGQEISSRQRDFKDPDTPAPVPVDMIAALNIDDDGARHEAIITLLRQSKASKEMAEWIDAIYGSLVTGESAMLLSMSRDTLIEGIRNGITQKEMRKTLETKIGDNASKARIMNIVRSNVARAWSNARLKEYQSLPKAEITGYQISAVMDSRTSTICRELDGKILKPEEAGRMNPPYHYQCRTILVPIFREEPKPKYDDLPDMEYEPGGYLKLKEEMG